MKLIALFAGTGAVLRLSLGFVPDKVLIRNITSANIEHIDWSRVMESLSAAGGGVKAKENSGAAFTRLASGAGVGVYRGGDKIASGSTAYQVLAELVDGYAGDMRAKGTLGLVDKWTLQHAGNRTGKFNVGVNTSLVGVGSVVTIKGKDYRIQALSNDGDADNEVTLSEAAPSTEAGGVEMITYKHDFVSAPVGMVTNAGIVISEKADVNVSGELCVLEAELFDK